MLKPVHAAVRTDLSATTGGFGEAVARADRGFRDVFRSRVLTSPPVFPDEYAGSPGRRVAGSPDRRIAGSPRLRPRDGHERVRMAAQAGSSVLPA